MGDLQYTSRERLAASIEESLRKFIPQPTRGDNLAESIDTALQDEACRDERTVAYLRLAATLAFVVLFPIVGRPDGAPDETWLRLDSLIVGIWAAAAIGVTVALRSGWYRPWVRRAFPSADAAMIVVTYAVLTPWVNPTTGWHAGSVAVSGLAALLALSGGLRLTRSAVYYSTAVAVAAVVLVAVFVKLAPAITAVVLVPVLMAGWLGLAITGLARRLIVTEVGHSAMRRLYGEAKEVIDAREEVLRIVAHDLRNPLSTVAMTTQLLLHVSSTDQQRADRLTIIQRAGERMNRLINDLLSVSIIEAGRLTVDPQPTAVRAILADAIEMLRPIAADKSVLLETSAPDDLPDVLADSGRILQVLSNLIGNAIKFTPKGGTITISVYTLGQGVRFEVADTGPGIPPEQLANIFGRFWQASRADSRGIGLGLSIAKGIVEAHGEQLRVSSTVGIGSTFSFQLKPATDLMRTTTPQLRAAPRSSSSR